MNRQCLAVAIALALLAQPGGSEARSRAPQPRPAAAARLEGLDYGRARQIVLGHGWRPVAGGCHASPGACALFPELGYCSGVDPGFCETTFVRPGRCLALVTAGGEPGPEGSGDTRVRSVAFRKGRCAKGD